jgi:hypothetical protein
MPGTIETMYATATTTVAASTASTHHGACRMDKVVGDASSDRETAIASR